MEARGAFHTLVVILVLATVRGLHDCSPPSPWRPFVVPAVVDEIYEFQGYECNGVDHDLTLKLDENVQTQLVDAMAVYSADPVRAEPGHGQKKVTSTVSLSSLVAAFLRGQQYASDFSAAILYTKVLVFVQGDKFPGLTDYGSYLEWTDGVFHLIMKKPGSASPPREIDLGPHSVCADGVCGPAICAPGVFDGNTFVVRGINVSVSTTRRKRFWAGYAALALAGYNRFQIQAMQTQVNKILDALDIQATLNDKTLASAVYLACYEEIKTYTTRALLDAVGAASENRDNAILEQTVLESLQSQTERNELRRQRVNDLNGLLSRFAVQRSINQRFASYMEHSDPYVAVSAYLNMDCPPLEAKFEGKLMVRDCMVLNATQIILDLPPFPVVQHYDSGGVVYHEEGCGLGRGVLATADSSLIEKTSQNATHYIVVRDGQVLLIEKSRNIVRGELPGRPLVLPDNQISRALDIKTNLSRALYEQFLESSGLNEDFRETIKEARDAAFKGLDLGDILGTLASLFKFSPFASCLPCCAKCPCFSAKCLGQTQTWGVAYIASTTTVMAYLLIGKIWARVVRYLPCMQKFVARISGLLLGAPTAESFEV